MSIKVKIVNEEESPSAILEVQHFEQDGDPITKKLKGGEEVEFTVHSTARLVVRQLAAE